MSIESVMVDATLDLVPHWYKATCGPNQNAIRIGDYEQSFYSHRALTPALREFLGISRAELIRFARAFQNEMLPSLPNMVQELLVSRWLGIQGQGVEWLHVFRVVGDLVNRSYENSPIVRNILISDGEGTTPIADPSCKKMFDVLASSPRTIMRVDRQLRFIGYEQVSYNEIKDPTDYKFYPSFLHPIAHTLKNSEISVHVTTRGDILFLANTGLLATRRKSRWKIYDVYTFKNSIVDIVGEYRVGCNLVQLLFDLSFRRHGALLVFDPERRVLGHIANRDCILPQDDANVSLPHLTLKGSVGAIAMGSREYGSIPTLLVQELASIDGALVFDKNQILAMGAVITPHPNVTRQIGARTTAAMSAYHWGARPVKVSSDGEVTFYFRSSNVNRESCDARIEFL